MSLRREEIYHWEAIEIRLKWLEPGEHHRSKGYHIEVCVVSLSADFLFKPIQPALKRFPSSSCLRDLVFRILDILQPFVPQPDTGAHNEQTHDQSAEILDELADQFPLAAE
jgi:hypothetical protein